MAKKKPLPRKRLVWRVRVLMAERMIPPLRAAIHDEELRNLNLEEVGLDNRVDGIDLNNNGTLAKIFRE